MKSELPNELYCTSTHDHIYSSMSHCVDSPKSLVIATDNQFLQYNSVLYLPLKIVINLHILYTGVMSKKVFKLTFFHKTFPLMALLGVLIHWTLCKELILSFQWLPTFKHWYTVHYGIKSRSFPCFICFSAELDTVGPQLQRISKHHPNKSPMTESNSIFVFQGTVASFHIKNCSEIWMKQHL